MKHIFIFNIIYVWAIVSMGSCAYKNEPIINFAKIELLFQDTSLNNICISKITSNQNYNKFIFMNCGKVYTVIEGLFNIDIYGNDFNDASKKDILKDFKYYSKILNSKGLVGCCLSIDNTLMLKTKDFNLEELELVDTNKIYKKFKYICMTTKNIRMSFVPHEYRSDLFFRRPVYFYYSNK